jgi:hypothetical protein
VNAATGAEVGTNDFRLSDMGPDGDANYDAFSPKVAYNSTDDEYLVVWWGDDNTWPLVNDEAEIFGQRVQAGTGAEIGSDFRLSDMGPNSNANFGAASPAVAYNSTNNEYVVVWWGDDDTGLLANDEWEIFGQRLNAATGAEVGSNDFRLSDMGPDGNANYAAILPAVAYNSTNNVYLVVWLGDDDTAPLVDGETETFGQRLNAATGAEVGTNDFRLSDMGPDGNPNYDAGFPAVAYDSTNNEYLVVWQGDDDTAPLVDEEWEIFGQRVNGGSGAEIGANDFRLSDMGGDVLFGAFSAAVAYDSADNQYLVVWSGDDNTLPLVDNEVEIFGQGVDAATGAEIGSDFRLSDMGPDGNVNFGAFAPAVAYNSTDNEYLVVWQGDDNTGLLVDNEFEIFGQRVQAATGAEIGSDFRLSDMGPDGNTNYTAQAPAVAYDSTDNQYLVVWHGDDNIGGLVDNEFEIFGQRVQADGTQMPPNDLRLSRMGPDGSVSYEARDPAIAYNGTDNEYLVVWQGEDDTPPLVMNEFEIFGQRVEADTGSVVGSDIRLSDMGTNGITAYGASNPAVAYNGADNEYLVVWQGDDNTAPLVDNEFEIFGQRVDGTTGTEVGTNDFRLSDMGPDGDITYMAQIPAVAYDSTNNEYLVVWSGDDDTPPLVVFEFEIFGQRVNGATGAEVGTNDFRLSDMGPDGNAAYAARNPAAAYNSTNSEYLVVWQGDDNIAPLVDNEVEIFGQRFSVLFRIYLPLVLRN